MLNILRGAGILLPAGSSGNHLQRLSVDIGLITVSDGVDFQSLSRVTSRRGDIADELYARVLADVIHAVGQHNDGFDMLRGQGLQFVVLLVDGIEEQRVPIGIDAVDEVEYVLAFGPQ